MDYRYDPNLALYLPLWEKDGSSFISSDAYGHLSTVTGATWGMDGRLFDGTDDVISIPDHSALDLSTGAYTVILWFKSTGGLSTGIGYERLLQKWITNTGFLLIHPDNGAIDFQGDTAVVTFSPTSYAAGQWYCIGVSANQAADTQRCFLNGHPDTVGTGFIIVTASAADLTIGGRVTPTTQQFTGTIGEVLVSNRTYTGQQQQEFYLKTQWRYR